MGTKEELESKCISLNSMNSKWTYHDKKVEKDFEVMVQRQFDNIGVDEFWDKFWSNNAIFSPIDWIKADPLNSNVESTEWKPDENSNWCFRNVSCITKLENLPAFFPRSISQCSSDTTFKFCKLEPNFYVVHKILKVNDIPYADCYNSH